VKTVVVICLYDLCAVQLNPALAFSLVPTENFSTEPVNFVAASEEIFNIWTDGINALLGKQVSGLLVVISAVITM